MAHTQKRVDAKPSDTILKPFSKLADSVDFSLEFNQIDQALHLPDKKLVSKARERLKDLVTFLSKKKSDASLDQTIVNRVEQLALRESDIDSQTFIISGLNKKIKTRAGYQNENLLATYDAARIYEMHGNLGRALTLYGRFLLQATLNFQGENPQNKTLLLSLEEIAWRIKYANKYFNDLFTNKSIDLYILTNKFYANDLLRNISLAEKLKSQINKLGRIRNANWMMMHLIKTGPKPDSKDYYKGIDKSLGFCKAEYPLDFAKVKDVRLYNLLYQFHRRDVTQMTDAEIAKLAAQIDCKHNKREIKVTESMAGLFANNLLLERTKAEEDKLPQHLRLTLHIGDDQL